MNKMEEASELLYQQLLRELKTKAIKSLVNMKKACDQIALARGEMSCAQVARIATESFGGPKAQTIRNNRKLKGYLECRKEAYRLASRATRQSEPPLSDNGNRYYPSEKLDTKTRVYIDLLWERLSLVERRYKILKEQQERSTKANPINLASGIEVGPNAEGVLVLAESQSNTALLDIVRESIEILLELTNHVSSLRYERIGGIEKLVLKRASGDHTVLTPAQLTAIRWFAAAARNMDGQKEQR
jgi:hypothetical protein